MAALVGKQDTQSSLQNPNSPPLKHHTSSAVLGALSPTDDRVKKKKKAAKWIFSCGCHPNLHLPPVSNKLQHYPRVLQCQGSDCAPSLEGIVHSNLVQGATQQQQVWLERGTGKSGKLWDCCHIIHCVN